MVMYPQTFGCILYVSMHQLVKLCSVNSGYVLISQQIKQSRHLVDLGLFGRFNLAQGNKIQST